MTEYMKGGKVRRWLDSQGYGFIKRDSGGHDLFLHRQQVIASGVDPYDINENVRVYFDIGRDKNCRDVSQLRRGTCGGPPALLYPNRGIGRMYALPRNGRSALAVAHEGP